MLKAGSRAWSWVDPICPILVSDILLGCRTGIDTKAERNLFDARKGLTSTSSLQWPKAVLSACSESLMKGSTDLLYAAIWTAKNSARFKTRSQGLLRRGKLERRTLVTYARYFSRLIDSKKETLTFPSSQIALRWRVFTVSWTTVSCSKDAAGACICFAVWL